MVDPIKAEHLVEEPDKIGPKALGVVLSHQYLIKSPLAFKSRMAKKNIPWTTPLRDFPWKASTKRNNNMQPLMPDRSSYSVPKSQCSEHAPAGVAARDVASSFAPGASAFPPGRGPGRSKHRTRCPLQGSTQGPCPVVSVLNTWMVNFPSIPLSFHMKHQIRKCP